MSSFEAQHPNYHHYKNDNFSNMNDISYYFLPSLKGFIHKQLMRNAEDAAYIAWGLHDKLAAITGMSPTERIPYNDMLDEVIKIFRRLIEKSFPLFMDALAILLSEFRDEEDFNKFLETNNLGYLAEYYNGHVTWSCQDGTQDQSDLYLRTELEPIKLIGEGYFAEVHKFKHKSSGKEYAMKKLKSKFKNNLVYKRRFAREIKILEKLQGHTNIISIEEPIYDERDKVYSYLMPYIKENLFNYIQKNNNTLSEKQRIDIFYQVIKAIGYAHSLNILHRDLSPRNILIENGNVFVSDFGLGKDFSRLNTRGYSTVEGYGAYPYIAPEQIKQLDNASEQSDIYSLGRLLYFILTGREPVHKYIGVDKFYSLIVTATSEEPNHRHANTTIFEEEFNKIAMQSQTNISKTVR